MLGIKTNIYFCYGHYIMSVTYSTDQKSISIRCKMELSYRAFPRDLIPERRLINIHAYNLVMSSIFVSI